MDRCWAFTTAYNESFLIRYWVRHYRTFCDKVIVYVDDATTDDTGPAAFCAGADDIRYFPTMGLDDVGFVNFAQEQYKEARGQAEWVIWVDSDEILYCPDMAARLDSLYAAGVMLPVVQGYQMIAEAPPKTSGQIYDEIRFGLPAPEYNKPCIFRPMLEMQWSPGKHSANVHGGATRDTGRDPLKLLHYRYLGEQWLIARNERNYARVTDENRKVGHGKEVYPDWQGRYSASWFREHRVEATDVVGGISCP